MPSKEAVHFIDLILRPFDDGDAPLNKQIGFLKLLKDLSKNMRHHVREYLDRFVSAPPFNTSHSSALFSPTMNKHRVT